MKYRRQFLKLLVTSTFLFFGLSVQAAEPLKIAFVYIGPVGDAGWTYAHDQARLKMQKELGDKVKTSYVENVPEGADAERVIRKLAANGNKLIFTTSFGYMNPTVKVAREFPNVVFEHATGYKTAKNLGTYEANMYQGAYLLGVIAGKMTKSNLLGVVASYPIPEVVRNVDAYTLGAQSVNPKVKTKVIWVNSWYNPGKERQAAETLIAQGVDVLSQNTDSPAALQAAAAKGVYGFGWNSDMKKFAPKSELSASVLDWSHYYIRTAKAVLNGTWKSQKTREGLKKGMVVLAPLNPVIPKDVVAVVDAKKAAIINGSLHPFQGPIVDQSGKVRVAKGDVMPLKEMMSLNFYVKGIEGNLPK